MGLASFPDRSFMWDVNRFVNSESNCLDSKTVFSWTFSTSDSGDISDCFYLGSYIS